MITNKIKKVLEYIELNRVRACEIIELCDYFELSNDERWFILKKFNLV